MKEQSVNFWDYPAYYLCIPTNGALRHGDSVEPRNGEYKGVMGAGIAAQARERYANLEKRLGRALTSTGNHVALLTPRILMFPTKHHWRDQQSDLDLIKRSAEELAYMARFFPEHLFALARPGCGHGGRDWETEVKPVLEQILPDNVIIIERPGA